MGDLSYATAMVADGCRRFRRLGADLLFPLRCWACGQWRQRSSHATAMHGPDGLSAELFCAACHANWKPIKTPACSGCGRPFHGADIKDHICGDCLDTPRQFDAARAIGHYNGALRAVIHRYKYQGHVGLMRPLARAMAQVVADVWPGLCFDAIVPVPLHSKRWRRRGYNQAELLANGLSEILKMPMALGALVRRRPTQPQAGLGALERRQNLRGAFASPADRGIANARMLLVDDVYTTGATVDAAAKVLRMAGAVRIHVITVARTD